MNDASLPADVSAGLDQFAAAAKDAFGDDLVSILLFGSAAEGRMRATSDVNLVLVLARFEKDRVDRLRDAFRHAHATIRLEAMLVLESELPEVAEAFAVKFADIRARHRVIAGRDVAASIMPSRQAMSMRLRQVLLNYILRMRERYVLVSLREEQLPSLVAESAGPLRAAAEVLLQLDGQSAASPKEALQRVAEELHPGRWTDALEHLSQARETGRLPPGVGAPALLALIALAQRMRDRAAKAMAP